MKKVLLSLLFGILVSTFSFANYGSLFSYNETTLNGELKQLQKLEDYIQLNPGISLAQMQAENNLLLSKLNLVTAQNFDPNSSEIGSTFGIPAFFWGCVFGWAGIIAVYVFTKEKDEAIKAFGGCVINQVLQIVMVVIYFSYYY